jgi:hypothetical protein
LQGAQLIASGAQHGGRVLVGGSAFGGGRAPAQRVSIDSSSRIEVPGGAGEVVAFAKHLQHAGTIDASGGASGAGGVVELSGAGALQLQEGWAARVDVSSASGRPGLLVLDPTNITIQAGSVGAITSSPVAMSPVGAADIASFLQNTGNLVVSTAIGGADAGDITMDAGASITWTSTNSLSLDANRAITFNSGASIDGGGSITITANDGGVTTGPFTGVDINGASITTSGGALIIEGNGGSTAGNGVQIRGSATVGHSGSGNMTIAGAAPAGDDIVLQNGSSIAHSGTGALILVADDVSLVGSFTATSLELRTQTADATIGLGTGTTGLLQVVDNEFEALTADTVGELVVDQPTGDIDIGDVSAVAAVTISGDAITGTALAAQGNVDLTGASSVDFSGSVESTAGSVVATAPTIELFAVRTTPASGTAGDVTLAGRRQVRLTGMLGSDSIDTTGPGGDGAIEIQWGLDTPDTFVVGDSTVCGSAGALNAGGSVESGPRTFTSSATIGTITLTTLGIEVDPTSDPLVLIEGEDSQVVTLRLAGAPTSAVDIELDGGDQVELSLDDQTFASTQTVSLTDTVAATIYARGVEDGIDEPDHGGAITFAVTSSDAVWDGFPLPLLSATISDAPGGAETTGPGTTSTTTDSGTSGPATSTTADTTTGAPTASATATDGSTSDTDADSGGQVDSDDGCSCRSGRSGWGRLWLLLPLLFVRRRYDRGRRRRSA